MVYQEKKEVFLHKPQISQLEMVNFMKTIFISKRKAIRSSIWKTKLNMPGKSDISENCAPHMKYTGSILISC